MADSIELVKLNDLVDIDFQKCASNTGRHFLGRSITSKTIARALVNAGKHQLHQVIKVVENVVDAGNIEQLRARIGDSKPCQTQAPPYCESAQHRRTNPLRRSRDHKAE
ncbi:MAG: hypothetical protein U0936_24095 [Planctomycetaceae bacterium]